MSVIASLRLRTAIFPTALWSSVPQTTRGLGNLDGRAPVIVTSRREDDQFAHKVADRVMPGRRCFLLAGLCLRQFWFDEPRSASDVQVEADR